MVHNFNPDILRAYDIRGTYNKTLFDSDAYEIGRRFALTLYNLNQGKNNLTICVGRDGRLSSPQLAENLIKGMTDQGVNVLDMGVGPTPMLYFMIQHHHANAGVVVTGSHNPPEDNGFKLSLLDRPFFGQDIQNLKNDINQSNAIQSLGKVIPIDHKPYLDRIIKTYNQDNPFKNRALKVVWDCANGPMGPVLKELVPHLNGSHIILNESVDGTFPAHPPDPSVKKNLTQLICEIENNQADLGIAFDGDGDRLVAVDRFGRNLKGDELLILFAQDLLKSVPGATVIGDIKSSQLLTDEVLKAGGNPIIWKTGHSFIKQKMKETGAILAGEVSGHMFFAHNYYGFDDALYGAVLLLNILEKGTVLNEWYDQLPRYHTTDETKHPIADHLKFDKINQIQKFLKTDNIIFNDIDGVRVDNPDGWWLVRASNTQACLITRCEGKCPQSLEKQRDQLNSYLKI